MKKQLKNLQIVCFAGSDWWYQNRGLFVPQIMSRLAKRHKVVFINSIGMRIPSLKNDKKAIFKIFRKLKSILRCLRKDSCGMYVFSPISIPFQNKAGKKLNQYFLSFQVNLMMRFLSIQEPIIYIGCPPAWDVIKKNKYRCLIYERTDIFEEMPGANKDYITELNQELVKASDLIIYVNRKLMQQDQTIPSKGLMLGHGVDYALFSSAHQSDYVPEDIRSIPGPIVGFFGDISNKTSNLKLLEHAAGVLPELSFVFVGPISTDVRSLKELPNVYFLGAKPYEQIPHYGKMFDVAIMPWNQNRWIELCNPVKTKEYLALGNPIVSMYYPEIEPYKDLIYVAHSPDEFVNAIRQAVQEKDEDLRRRRQEAVREETWDNKVQMIEDSIQRITCERN